MPLGSGIFVEFMRLPHTGELNTYLVHRDGMGDARVIAGAPESFTGDTSGGLEIDQPVETSRAAYGPSNSPRTRQAVKLPTGERAPEEVWRQMTTEAEALRRTGRVDNVMGNTKVVNAINRGLLDNAGVDWQPYIGANKLVHMTGFDDASAEPVKQALRSARSPSQQQSDPKPVPQWARRAVRDDENYVDEVMRRFPAAYHKIDKARRRLGLMYVPDRPGETNKLDHVRSRLAQGFRETARQAREAEHRGMAPKRPLKELDVDEHARARARALAEMMSPEVTQELSRKLSPEQFQEELFRALAEHTFDKGLREEKGHEKLLEPLYKSMEIDPGILAADAHKQKKLKARLSSIPFLAKTYAGWEDLSKKGDHLSRKRQAIAVGIILDVAWDAYGSGKKPKLVFESLKTKTGTGPLAIYDPPTDTIKVDPYTDHFRKGRSPAGSIVDTVIEEAIHAYQWRLLQDLKEKRLSKGDPRFREAIKYLLNWNYPGMYLYSPPYDAHAGQPVERLPKKLQPWYP